MSSELITRFEYLKNKPQWQVAQALLQRVALHVTSIMINRKWTVGTLAELSPARADLLGLNENRGRKIMLRLRQPYNDTDFLPFDDVMGTMLHELAHNTFGAHDAKFYALLDDLNIEYDAVLAKGIPEDKTTTRKIGILETQRLAKQKARNAARGTGKQGKQLGGTSSAKEMRQLVLDAAERRAFDAKWCGSGREDNPVTLEEVETVPNLSTTIPHCVTTPEPTVIEISSDEDETTVARFRKRLKPTERGNEAQEQIDRRRMKQRGLLADDLYDHLKKIRSRQSSTLQSSDSPVNQWACPQCTYLNELIDSRCSICVYERPSTAGKVGNHWICAACETICEESLWTCTLCGKLKETS